MLSVRLKWNGALSRASINDVPGVGIGPGARWPSAVNTFTGTDWDAGACQTGPLPHSLFRLYELLAGWPAGRPAGRPPASFRSPPGKM